jgi:hypothetical protein
MSEHVTLLPSACSQHRSSYFPIESPQCTYCRNTLVLCCDDNSEDKNGNEVGLADDANKARDREPVTHKPLQECRASRYVSRRPSTLPWQPWHQVRWVNWVRHPPKKQQRRGERLDRQGTPSNSTHQTMLRKQGRSVWAPVVSGPTLTALTGPRPLPPIYIFIASLVERIGAGGVDDAAQAANGALW